MSPYGVLKHSRPGTSPGSVGYHDFFPLATSASAPSFNAGASFLATVSSNCPSLAPFKSATETPACLASCSSLKCNPRCALPMMSLKLSSKGIFTTTACRPGGTRASQDSRNGTARRSRKHRSADFSPQQRKKGNEGLEKSL